MTTLTTVLVLLLFVIAFMLWFIWKMMERCAMALTVLAQLAVHKHNHSTKEEVYTRQRPC
jgi:hypothetical protein